MNNITVSGPYTDKDIAVSVMNSMGSKTHSIYGIAKDKIDENGVEYTDFDDVEYFVERVVAVSESDKIFGYDAKEFMGGQNK